jgi:SNW domain-containing protein 1
LLERKGCTDGSFTRGGWKSSTSQGLAAVGDDEEASFVRETDDDVAARQRERLCLERKKEKERELRLESNQELKKQKFEQERDTLEKIALGHHTGHGGGLSGEVDSRLYNRTAGMDSGFGADDEYNTYSQPMFDRQGVSAASVYRPTRGET